MISTHAPRTGSDGRGRKKDQKNLISTHAPRTGSDTGQYQYVADEGQFQPTLPARGATSRTPPSPAPDRFQPTLPARGATAVGSVAGALGKDFNPRSPHGERPYGALQLVAGAIISTHAPRTGSDTNMTQVLSEFPTFQPTLPARGATLRSSSTSWAPANFNPRSPHGERPAGRYRQTVRRHISTHAPRTGSDAQPARNERIENNISTHAPRTGSDGGGLVGRQVRDGISTHAPRTGSDEVDNMQEVSEGIFQPTLPARGATNIVKMTLSD